MTAYKTFGLIVFLFCFCFFCGAHNERHKRRRNFPRVIFSVKPCFVHSSFNYSVTSFFRFIRYSSNSVQHRKKSDVGDEYWKTVLRKTFNSRSVRSQSLLYRYFPRIYSEGLSSLVTLVRTFTADNRHVIYTGANQPYPFRIPLVKRSSHLDSFFSRTDVL